MSLTYLSSLFSLLL